VRLVMTVVARVPVSVVVPVPVVMPVVMPVRAAVPVVRAGRLIHGIHPARQNASPHINNYQERAHAN
jgi:hypothetical protein